MIPSTSTETEPGKRDPIEVVRTHIAQQETYLYKAQIMLNLTPAELDNMDEPIRELVLNAVRQFISVWRVPLLELLPQEPIEQSSLSPPAPAAASEAL